MFKNTEKEKKKKDKQNVENLPEDYKTEKEKLVENKMDEIETSLKNIEDHKKIDLSTIPEDLSQLELEIQQERAKSQTKPKTNKIVNKKTQVSARFKPDLKDILPVWIEKPFYYITPQEKFHERRKLWQKEWGDFLIQWANAKDKYIIEILTLQKEYPFKNPIINKELNNDQLELIGDYLTEKGEALWKNKNKTHIRIYWEPLEVTAEKIFDWAFERGQKYIGVLDILDSKEVFADLSTEEIKECLIILVKNKKGEWADKNKEMAYLLFPV